LEEKKCPKIVPHYMSKAKLLIGVIIAVGGNFFGRGRGAKVRIFLSKWCLKKVLN